MNTAEAKLELHTALTELLTDVLSGFDEDPDGTADDPAFIDSMRDIADLLMEALKVEVIAVDGETATLTVDLSVPDDDLVQ